MAWALLDYLATVGDLADFMADAADRHDKNPVINPPSDGDWIIVSEERHVIVLYHDGQKVRQISSFSTGGVKEGKPHPTPVGKFTVISKDQDHTSSKYKDRHGNPAKMSYYVQFAPSVGFHVGDPDVSSHGCVHLTEADARFVFDWARVDKTHVWVLRRQAAKRDDDDDGANN